MGATLMGVAHLHVVAPGTPGLPALTLMWFAMMALMMAPTAWPWLRAFDRFGLANGSSYRTTAVALFGSGYLAAWFVYAAAAAIVQSMFARAGALDSAGALAQGLGAAVLILAGLFQFTPLKHACLTHCRNPFSYFLARWRNGPVSGFRMGWGHGLFCVGCCWALMATTLAVGMTSLWWMAALALVVFVEQTVIRGDRLRVPMGVALVLAGLVRTFPA